jgi:sporulation related protein
LSLRATFLLLLLANLAFLGWAALIDVPSEPPPSDSNSNLPQLKLLSEVRGKRSSSDQAPAAGSSALAPATPAVAGIDTTRAPAANGSGGTAVSAGAASAGAPSGGAASGGAAPGGAASAGTAPTGPNSTISPVTASGESANAASRVAQNDPASGRNTASATRRCITIGPFTDPENAREAADVLRERGFTPHARTAANRSPQGYWVFVGGLKTPADETSVVHRLERNGISDAKVMPTSAAGLRVSVGLFNALDGAERRARAVRLLGLDAQVEPRQAPEVHWVDVDLDSSTQSLPAEGLLSLEEAGSRMEIKECPAPEQGAPAGTLTAAGHAGPG